jgi:hypothetical protein
MNQKLISKNFKGIVLFTAEVSEDSSSLSIHTIIVSKNFRHRFKIFRNLLDLACKKISSFIRVT